jgi:hypothetical protein
VRNNDTRYVRWGKKRGRIILRFSPFGGCERVDQSRIFSWESTHSDHSLLIHSFTSIKRRKSHWQKLQS